VPWPEAGLTEPGEPPARRLAQAILVAMLCALAVVYVLFVADNDNGVPGGYGTPVVAWTSAAAVAIVILQLRHSWPSGGVARPRRWPVTLLLQAAATYALFPVTGWHSMIMCGFLAGSALLLVPGRLGRVVFAAVIAGIPVLFTVKPPQTLTAQGWQALTPEGTLGGMLFLTVDSAALGLLVYGLTRLVWLAVQLESLRGELARKAVAGERLRVARDTHDLLGLGLSAIAMKADLIGKLIGRDDARASGEIAELARICATAGADMRLVAGEARDLPLDAELAAARDVLASAGIDVHMCVSAGPPQEAASVLVPVLREAVTNILKHSSARRCTLDLTADAGQLRLSVSNDVGGDPGGTAGHDRGGGTGGSGLLNLAARLEAAGGRLAVRREDGTFSMTAELPLSAGAPAEAV
jgi:two-component system sensor histidine kinase DesK